MTDASSSWTLEGALEVLQHPTVDSRTWAEAVEWMLLYGPPELQNILMQSSSHATLRSFPELTPAGCSPDGTPCYRIGDLAESLEISMDEAARVLLEKELTHGQRQLFDDDETNPAQ